MKNRLLSISLLLLFWTITIQAYEIDSPKDLMRIKNKDNQSKVYAKLFNGKEILVYKTKPIFPMDYSFLAYDYGDLLPIDLKCYPHTSFYDCKIMVDRRTGEHAFFNNMQAFNYRQKKIGFFYDKKNSLVIIKPLFKPCTKPLMYKLRLYSNSEFGVKTDFLPNGNLQIDYARASDGKSALKIIHINYPKLFTDCQS
jgi:hypothetical protein